MWSYDHTHSALRPSLPPPCFSLPRHFCRQQLSIAQNQFDGDPDLSGTVGGGGISWAVSFAWQIWHLERLRMAEAGGRRLEVGIVPPEQEGDVWREDQKEGLSERT